MRRLTALFTALATCFVLFGVATTANAEGIDSEEQTAASRTGTDNSGPSGDLATGGASTSTWKECMSKRINKYHTRGSNSKYDYIVPASNVPNGYLEMEAYLMAGDTMFYRYCPNGDKPDKFKPFRFKYCHLHSAEGQPGSFQGVHFVTWLTDDKKMRDYPRSPTPGPHVAFFVPKAEDGTGPGSGGGVCREYRVPKEERVWYRVVRNVLPARWTTEFWMKSNADPMSFDSVTEDGNRIAYINPRSDTNIGGWYGGPEANFSDANIVDDGPIPPYLGDPSVRPVVTYDAQGCPTLGGCEYYSWTQCAPGYKWFYGLSCVAPETFPNCQWGVWNHGMCNLQPCTNGQIRDAISPVNCYTPNCTTYAPAPYRTWDPVDRRCEDTNGNPFVAGPNTGCGFSGGCTPNYPEDPPAACEDSEMVYDAALGYYVCPEPPTGGGGDNPPPSNCGAPGQVTCYDPNGYEYCDDGGGWDWDYERRYNVCL